MLAWVTLPYFTTRMAQYELNLLGNPLAVGNPFAPITAVSAEASQAGVQLGMLPHQAWAICPELHIIEPQPNRNERVLQQVEDKLLYVSPKFKRVNQSETHASTWIIDLKHIPVEQIADVATQISMGLQKLTTLKPQIGIARSAFTTQIAAHGANEAGYLWIPAEETQAFLAPQSVSYLQLPPKLAKRLQQFGIQTLGQIAEASVLAWQEQFGLLGKELYIKAKGQDRIYIPPYEPPEQFSLSHEFNNPVVHQQPLHYWITELSTKLACDLQKRRQQAQRLSLQIELEDRTHLERTLILRIPTAQAPTLGSIFKSCLNSLQFTVGITDLMLTVDHLVTPQPIQLRLFEDSLYQRQRLNATLQNLRLRFQPQSIQQISLHTHTPLLHDRIQRVGLS